MFDYKNVDRIDLLPEDMQERVRAKKNKDELIRNTVKYKFESGLMAIERIFANRSLCSDDFSLAILRFMKLEGSEAIVESEEFREMTIIAVVNLLSNTTLCSEDLLNIDLIMVNVLETNIGDSEFYKGMFLDLVAKRAFSTYEARKTLNVVETVLISKEEYLLAMEESASRTEREVGLSSETLERRVFLETEKAKIGLNTETDFSEYLKLADKYLEDSRVYMAVVIFRSLKKVGFSLEKKKEQVLLAYEESELGKKDEKATRKAKQVKLIPYDNILDRIIGYFG